MLRLVIPGSDEFVTEKYAAEIKSLLDEWRHGITGTSPDLTTIGKSMDASIKAVSLIPIQEIKLRSAADIQISRRKFGSSVGREEFLATMKTYLSAMAPLQTAEFEIVGIEETAGSPSAFNISIRYDFVGTHGKVGREERVGKWQTLWSRNQQGVWRILKWEADEEIVSRRTALRSSSMSHPRLWGARTRTKIRCFMASTIGAL